ncbi:Orm1 type endoplasmic reticulum protein [Thelephora terrestris]|uniref:Orm1 type endoplasmic reticulum protein n=1 Tax=Thelephora terrestris TaxID=56493 RepID=A0A9P6H9G6_9AGAM|nr:Orm1 type endoplasmic reticulum protein [Thelephora terrestris]
MTTMTTQTGNPTLSLPEKSTNQTQQRTRTRSGSLLKVEQVGEGSAEQDLDQNLYVNINADWVNMKGAWLVHPVLVFCGKIVIDTIPGMNQEISWTLTNLLYLLVSYFIFHWATGIPFQSDLHGGAYDELTLWEQIDGGAQYTPTKKWLITFPIILFLLSTHYTHYDPWLFTMNLTALVALLIPRLPQLHRHRVRFLSEEQYHSGMSTPVEATFVASGSTTPIEGRTVPVTLKDSHFH